MGGMHLQSKPRLLIGKKLCSIVWLPCTLALFLGLNHIRPENEAINTWVHAYGKYFGLKTVEGLTATQGRRVPGRE